MILMITSFTATERAAKNTSRFQLQLYLIRTHATLLVSSHVAFFTSANDDSSPPWHMLWSTSAVLLMLCFVPHFLLDGCRRRRCDTAIIVLWRPVR